MPGLRIRTVAVAVVVSLPVITIVFGMVMYPRGTAHRWSEVKVGMHEDTVKSILLKPNNFAGYSLETGRCGYYSPSRNQTPVVEYNKVNVLVSMDVREGVAFGPPNMAPKERGRSYKRWW